MTVSREKAAELKDAGWKEKTAFAYDTGTGLLVYKREARGPAGDWLPAPDLSELGKVVSEDDLSHYWTEKVKKPRTAVSLVGGMLENAVQYGKWLYKVLTDPNLLADVWLWKERS